MASSLRRGPALGRALPDGFARYAALWALGVAVAAGLAWPSPAGAEAPPLRGVMLHSLWAGVTAADMDRELDLARAAGSNVVRVDVGWSTLESGGKGSYERWYLERLDRLVSGAQARGLRVIVVFWGSPCWASSAPERLRLGCAGRWWEREGIVEHAPRFVGDYADAARFLVERYGPALAALEVWNEPNSRAFWRAASPVASYAALVRATGAAVRATGSGVPVLAGSLAGADVEFLSALYRHGIAGSYDGLAIHPYSDPGELPRDLGAVRAAQRAAGDGTGLWVTEFGWSTAGAAPGTVGEAVQAAYVREAVRVLAGVPDVRAAIVYSLRDNGVDASDREQGFGLVRRDFTPKPAFGSMRAALGLAGDVVLGDAAADLLDEG